MQAVEAKHRLGEGPDTEQRAGGRSRRDLAPAISVRGRREWAESSDGRQQARGREEAHLDQIAARDASPGELSDNLHSILPGVLGFPQPSSRCAHW